MAGKITSAMFYPIAMAIMSVIVIGILMTTVVPKVTAMFADMGATLPWNTQLPSEYIKKRMRFSLQPLDAPLEPRHLLQIIDALDSDDLLLFSTDYPHWHFDTPEEALPAGLPDAVRRKILYDNAQSFYRL